MGGPFGPPFGEMASRWAILGTSATQERAENPEKKTYKALGAEDIEKNCVYAKRIGAGSGVQGG